jgi:hypothetical protein
MNSRTLKIAGISFLILLLLLVITKYYVDRYKLENENRITIGNVDNYIELFGRSGYDLYFSYTVNGNEYEKVHTVYENPKSLINKRFFVVFHPSNPKNSEILLNTPVPIELEEAPYRGWERIPK